MKLLTKIPTLAPRVADAHKGQFGHCLIVAGSESMPGAAMLAVGAALRGGAGYVSLAAPYPVLLAAPVRVPEAMLLNLSPHWGVAQPALGARAAKLVIEASSRMQSCLLGPGLGLEKPTVAFLRKTISAIACPLVVDADALNALGTERKLLLARRAPSILTPHPGEMARLLGIDVAAVQADREGAAVRLARQARAIVALKGHRSVVTDGETLYVNETGNPGMARAGMGDVLGGFLASLLARGMQPFDAAVLGVFLHGVAGDLAAQKFGQESMRASDVIDAIPEAFLRQFPRK